MYWRISYSSKINTFLEKEDCSVELLLNEDDVVTEVREQNLKLVEYLSQNAHLKLLMKYMLQRRTIFTATINDRELIKYPSVSSEILCADSLPLMDALISDDEVLRSLIHFFDHQPSLQTHSSSSSSDASSKEMDFVAASYASKLMTNLFKRNFLKMYNLCQVLSQTGEEGEEPPANYLLHLLLNNVSCTPVLEFILNLFKEASSSPDRQKLEEWSIENDLIGSLISLLNQNSTDKYLYGNIYYCLMVLLQSFQFEVESAVAYKHLLQLMEDDNTYLRLLSTVIPIVESESQLCSLFEDDEGALQKCCYNFIYGLPCIVHFFGSRMDIIGITANVIESFVDKSLEPQMLQLVPSAACLRLWKHLLLHLPSLYEYLKYFITLLSPESTYLANIAVSPVILSIIDFITHFISISQYIVDVNGEDQSDDYSFQVFSRSLVDKEGILCFSIITDYFFKRHWNSYLHKLYQRLIQSIISWCSISYFLFREFIRGTTFISQLLQTFEEQQNNKSLVSPRPGYMGHLIDISNEIGRYISSEEFQEWEASRELILEFERFKDEQLQQINFDNLIKEFPMRGWNDDEYDDDDLLDENGSPKVTHSDFAVEQLYENYCSIDITSSFVEEFGCVYTDVDDNDGFYETIKPSCMSSIEPKIKMWQCEKNNIIFEKTCNEAIKLLPSRNVDASLAASNEQMTLPSIRRSTFDVNRARGKSNTAERGKMGNEQDNNMLTFDKKDEENIVAGSQNPPRNRPMSAVLPRKTWTLMMGEDADILGNNNKVVDVNGDDDDDDYDDDKARFRRRIVVPKLFPNLQKFTLLNSTDFSTLDNENSSSSSSSSNSSTNNSNDDDDDEVETSSSDDNLLSSRLNVNESITKNIIVNNFDQVEIITEVVDVGCDLTQVEEGAKLKDVVNNDAVVNNNNNQN